MAEPPIGICKLCRKLRPLCDSHLMPAALFRKSRTPDHEPPDPLVVLPGRRFQTSEQAKDYVFCYDCEQRLSKQGENYVMRLVGNDVGFPLLETLKAAQGRSILGQDVLGYTVAATPSIDRDQLAYYALSVFWRASVHVWTWLGTTLTIDLGRDYNEGLRQYLLGLKPIPSNISLWACACEDRRTQQVSHFPSSEFNRQFRQYSSVSRGILFFLMVGKAVPERVREMCCVTSKDKWIFVFDCEEATVRRATALLKSGK